MPNLRIVNLGSSSQGNCTYYEYGDDRILVDVGLSARQIEYRLREIGSDIRSITHALITHEHNDHIQGVKVLSKRFDGIKFFSNYETFNHFSYVGNIQMFRSGFPFVFGENKIICKSIRVPHTAAEPVGFRLWFDETSVTHLTDLGYVDDATVEDIACSEVVLIESNYDPKMLEQSDRPFDTDRRNFGRTGHLSNNECATALCKAKHLNVDDSWRPAVGLLHLSRSFNTPGLALAELERVAGLKAVVTTELSPTVVFPFKPSVCASDFVGTIGE